MPVAGERAIEVLPTHATPAGLDALRAMGFTAVSIGAQSFHDEVLHRLRRPHDARTARAAVIAAQGRFELVDVDLIVDVELDDQLAGAFLRDLTECFEVGVDQVSTYPLMRFGYTPFGRTRHDRRREHEVLAGATQIAAEHGYERRSVWTFNRMGSATYTSITRRRFLGMGAGASSFLGQDFLVNHFGVRAYVDAVRRGRLPVARWLHLGSLGGTAYDAFWQAYAGRISPAALAVDHPDRIRGLDLALAPLVGAGLVRRIGSGQTAGYRADPAGVRPVPRPRADRHLPADRATLGPDARGARPRRGSCHLGHAGPAPGQRRLVGRQPGVRAPGRLRPVPTSRIAAVRATRRRFRPRTGRDAPGPSRRP